VQVGNAGVVSLSVLARVNRERLRKIVERYPGISQAVARRPSAYQCSGLGLLVPAAPRLLQVTQEDPARFLVQAKVRENPAEVPARLKDAPGIAAPLGFRQRLAEVLLGFLIVAEFAQILVSVEVVALLLALPDERNLGDVVSFPRVP